MSVRNRVFSLAVSFAGLGVTGAAYAGGHTWRVSEIFSNADGTIQFIEVRESANSGGETSTSGHAVTSNTRSFTITANVAAPTNLKTILIATPAFVGLPGAPTPDYVVPAGSVPFLAVTGDTIRYVPYCAFTFGAGVLPTDGINSIHVNLHQGEGSHTFTVGPNTPKNTAGVEGSINVGCSDGDGDGYGDPGSAACPAGPETDCDDGDADVNPGATEVCNDDLDNDCNTLADCADEACGCPAVSGPIMLVMATALGSTGILLLRRRWQA